MASHLGGRELEAIPEQAACQDGRFGFLHFVNRCMRPIQEQFEIPAPQLAVPGHRLIVQAHDLQVGAEKHPGYLFEARVDRQLVIGAAVAVPAVGACVFVQQQLLLDLGGIHIRGWLMQPAALGDAHALRPGAPGHQPQQRESARPAGAVFAGVHRSACPRKPGCPGMAAGGAGRPGSLPGHPPEGR